MDGIIRKRFLKVFTIYLSDRMTTEQLLAINEEFKKKGLLLSSEDLFDRLRLRDDMKTEC